MRFLTSQGLLTFAALLTLVACQPPEPLTAAKAQQIIASYEVRREPVYAAVPQKVWWNARIPKDDFDERSVRTLHNLERAGYVTVTESQDNGTTAYTAKVTPKGFPLLGTSPHARGPGFKALICYKRYDGLRDFQRPTTEPTPGRADLM